MSDGDFWVETLHEFNYDGFEGFDCVSNDSDSFYIAGSFVGIMKSGGLDVYLVDGGGQKIINLLPEALRVVGLHKISEFAVNIFQSFGGKSNFESEEEWDDFIFSFSNDDEEFFERFEAPFWDYYFSHENDIDMILNAAAKKVRKEKSC